MRFYSKTCLGMLHLLRVSGTNLSRCCGDRLVVYATGG